MHDSKSILIDFIFLVDLIYLKFGFVGELVLGHVVEVGSFYWTLKHMPEDLFLVFFAILLQLARLH